MDRVGAMRKIHDAFYKESPLTFETDEDGFLCPKYSADVRECIEHAIEIARDNGPVTFKFNWVILTVAKDSDADLLHKAYRKAFDREIGPEIGPYPKEHNSNEIGAVEREAISIVESFNKRFGSR